MALRHFMKQKKTKRSQQQAIKADKTMDIPTSYNEFYAWLYETSCTTQKRNHAAYESRRGWTMEKRGLHHFISAEEWLAAGIKECYAQRGDGAVRVKLRSGDDLLLKDAIALELDGYSKYVAEMRAIVAGQEILANN